MNQPRQILVGFDGSDQARDALALASVFVRVLDAKITAAAVHKSEVPIYVDWEEFESARKREIEDSLSTACSDVGVNPDVDLIRVESTSDARGLYAAANDIGADLVVIGSSHRGAIGRAVAGSVAASLLHGAPCPVSVAPRGYADRANADFRLVLAGFDNSPESQVALSEASAIAWAAGAQLRVVAVVESPAPSLASVHGKVSWDEMAGRLHREMQGLVAAAIESLPEPRAAEPRVVSGEAVQELLDQCADGVDLLILGSRGYGALRRVMLGSVSGRIVHDSPCPVLVVPATTRLSTDRSGERAKTVPA